MTREKSKQGIGCGQNCSSYPFRKKKCHQKVETASKATLQVKNQPVLMVSDAHCFFTSLNVLMKTMNDVHVLCACSMS